MTGARRPRGELAFVDIGPDDPRLASYAAPLLTILRPSLDLEGAIAFFQAAWNESYIVTLAMANGHGSGMAGHRVLTTSRGRILFVDDLVVSPDQRGVGIGEALLAHLEEKASTLGCGRIELDTGIGNEPAQLFYQRCQLNIAALHFSKSIANIWGSPDSSVGPFGAP